MIEILVLPRKLLCTIVNRRLKICNHNQMSKLVLVSLRVFVNYAFYLAVIELPGCLDAILVKDIPYLT